MITVPVDKEALRRVLLALIGPEHHIRELQVTRSLDKTGLTTERNPINVLVEQYDAAEASGKAPTEPGWYVVLPPDFDVPTVRAFGKDKQWWIPLGRGNGQDGWMSGREYQNWVGPIAPIDDAQPFHGQAPDAATVPAQITPELLHKLQTSTEGGALLCANYAGGYDLLGEIYTCIVNHLGLKVSQ